MLNFNCLKTREERASFRGIYIGKGAHFSSNEHLCNGNMNEISKIRCATLHSAGAGSDLHTLCRDRVI